MLAMQQKRQDWIDILKGLGIAAVVIGHIVPGTAARIIYLFHMPLFFFLSGYLFRPSSPAKMLSKGTKRLLVPYACFLIVLFLPTVILFDGHITAPGALRFAAKFVYGGSILIGYEAAFWFVTCLFITQQVANLLDGRSTRTTVYVVVVMAVAAYANARFAPSYRFPWAANIVLIAVPLFFVGRFARDIQWSTPRVAFFCLVAATSIVAVVHGAAIGWDMKYVTYGIPGLSVVVAFSWFIALAALSRGLARVPLISPLLAAIGRMSFGIMFMHMTIQMALQNNLGLHDPWYRALAALACSLLTSLALHQFNLTRMAFLGNDFRSPKDPPIVTRNQSESHGVHPVEGA